MTKKKANPRPKCKSTTNNKEWKEWRKTESSINLERPLRIANLKHDENGKHLSQTIQIHSGESFKPIIHTIFNQCTHQIQIDFENVNTNLIPEEPLQQGERCRCVQIVHNVQSTRRNKSIVMVTAISRIKKTKISIQYSTLREWQLRSAHKLCALHTLFLCLLNFRNQHDT